MILYFLTALDLQRILREANRIGVVWTQCPCRECKARRLKERRRG